MDFLVTLRRLKKLNVDVYFELEHISLFDAGGEFVLTLHAGLAQSESEEKSENIKWGIRSSTLDPASPAFSRRCYGYDRDDEGNLVINANEAAVVEKIFGLYELGWSITKIKKELETSRIPSPTGKRRWPVKTIGNILANRKYTGDSVYGETESVDYPSLKRTRRPAEDVPVSRNHHPAIIDKDRFDKVQKLREIRSNIEIGPDGEQVRKSTHYSMKKVVRESPEPFND